MLRIVTDSASDIPQEVKDRYHLHVIPTPVVISGVDYLDGETIKPDDFYRIQEAGTEEISTYHINPAMFEDAFLPYAQRGDEVIYLCFSTGIAATFNAANIAKETILEDYPEFDLTIVDSRCASIGFGLLVYYLLVLQEKGAEKEMLLEAAEFYKQHIRHVFTVPTLEYLIKGGRITKTKGMIAQTLDIKPVLIVDEQGSLKVLRLVRGKKKSLHALVDYLKELGQDLQTQKVGICHGAAPDTLQEVLSMTEGLIQEPMITKVGCAIGAHTGKGMIGICFLDAPDPYK